MPGSGDNVHLVAILQIPDLDAFEQYERQALKILESHGGTLLDVIRSDDNSTEIHHLSFPDETAFAAFKNDTPLQQLLEMRQRAISNTTIYAGNRISY
ncbi:MAG: DUF1330 domain-containing protein [Gammaproteobacteria bacterium]